MVGTFKYARCQILTDRNADESSVTIELIVMSFPMENRRHAVRLMACGIGIGASIYQRLADFQNSRT